MIIPQFHAQMAAVKKFYFWWPPSMMRRAAEMIGFKWCCLGCFYFFLTYSRQRITTLKKLQLFSLWVCSSPWQRTKAWQMAQNFHFVKEQGLKANLLVISWENALLLLPVQSNRSSCSSGVETHLCGLPCVTPTASHGVCKTQRDIQSNTCTVLTYERVLQQQRTCPCFQVGFF